MSNAVQNLLDSFAALPEPEKHELASAILRWSTHCEGPALTDDELIRSADDIFVALDEQEEGGSQGLGA